MLYELGVCGIVLKSVMSWFGGSQTQSCLILRSRATILARWPVAVRKARTRPQIHSLEMLETQVDTTQDREVAGQCPGSDHSRLEGTSGPAHDAELSALSWSSRFGEGLPVPPDNRSMETCFVS